MSQGQLCEQIVRNAIDPITRETCRCYATHRVFWPGQPPKFVCEKHGRDIVGLGDAMGCPIHSEPILPDSAGAANVADCKPATQEQPT